MDELIFKVLMLKGEAGNNITRIEKTSTTGLTDTYTITLTDGTTTTFEVTNGSNIQSIEKTASAGLVDTYTISMSDGQSTVFTVTNGNGIASIEKTATAGLVDTYTITFDNGSTTTFDITNGDHVDTNALKAEIKEEVYKEMYPVGHVLISFDSANPAKYGTVWERTGEGRMLIGVSSDYAVGATGGEAEHTLTVDELAPHEHNITPVNTTGTAGSSTAIWFKYSAANEGSLRTDATGTGQPHNNMPPYIAVYMWRRVS